MVRACMRRDCTKCEEYNRTAQWSMMHRTFMERQGWEGPYSGWVLRICRPDEWGAIRKAMYRAGVREYLAVPWWPSNTENVTINVFASAPRPLKGQWYNVARHCVSRHHDLTESRWADLRGQKSAEMDWAYVWKEYLFVNGRGGEYERNDDGTMRRARWRQSAGGEWVTWPAQPGAPTDDVEIRVLGRERPEFVRWAEALGFRRSGKRWVNEIGRALSAEQVARWFN